MEMVRRECGFQNMFAANRTGNSGGLALLWKENFKVSLLSFSKNYIDVIVQEQGRGIPWRLTCIYGEPNQGQRRDFWNHLTLLRDKSSVPWLCGGI